MFDTGACWVLEFVFICNVIHMNSAFQVLHWSFGLSKFRACLSKYWGWCLFCWLGGQPTEVSAGTRQSVRRPIGNPHTTLCTNIRLELYLHNICVRKGNKQNWRDGHKKYKRPPQHSIQFTEWLSLLILLRMAAWMFNTKMESTSLVHLKLMPAPSAGLQHIPLIVVPFPSCFLPFSLSIPSFHPQFVSAQLWPTS